MRLRIIKLKIITIRYAMLDRAHVFYVIRESILFAIPMSHNEYIIFVRTIIVNRAILFAITKIIRN
jgi:hypothetical protein